MLGVLCARCRSLLPDRVPLSPEQIMPPSHVDSFGAVVDRWGRVHRFAHTTRIGRVGGDDTLSVLTSSVSRWHALVTLADDESWRVRDLGSTNGTFIDDQRVTDERVLRDRARLRIGRIGFFFLADATGLSTPALPRTISKTIRPPSDGEVSRSTLNCAAQPELELDLEFEQPTGGGGAVLRVGGRCVQLTIAQHDLVRLLIERRSRSAPVNEQTRGFVTMDELLARLSLDSSEASASNVRQLVRRVRRLLQKAGIGDLIDSRPGRGYRLTVKPTSRRRAPSSIGSR